MRHPSWSGRQRRGPRALDSGCGASCAPEHVARAAQESAGARAGGIHRPCQATANVVLGVLQKILEEQALKHGGQLSTEEIGQLLERFKRAPGRLESFYDETYDRCWSAPKVQRAKSPELAAFEDKVRALGTRSSGNVALGRLQMIGLHAVRKQLGGRWEAVAETVHAVAEKVVRCRLSDEDSYIRNPEGDIVVCFGALEGEQAWLKAQSIECEIRERLLGCEDSSALSKFDLDFQTLSDVARVSAETHDLAAPVEGLDGETDVCALVGRRLDEAQRAMRHRAQEWLERLSLDWRVEPRTITVGSGAPARFRVAGVDARTQRGLDRIMPIMQGDAGQLVDIDLLALGAAAAYLCDGGASKELLLAVGIHASSVTDRLAYERFTSQCRRLTHVIREHLILVLEDLPPNISPTALTDTLRCLRGFSRLQAIRLRTPRIDRLLLKAAAIPLVLVGYDATSALMRHDPNALRRFMADVREAGARLLVDDVPHPTAAEALHKGGVDMWSLRSPEPADHAIVDARRATCDGGAQAL